MEWRHTCDPYRIVVSEVILQQTQVPRVAVMYPKFIETFPDIQTLAKAEHAELLAAWQGWAITAVPSIPKNVHPSSWMSPTVRSRKTR